MLQFRLASRLNRCLHILLVLLEAVEGDLAEAVEFIESRLPLLSSPLIEMIKFINAIFLVLLHHLAVPFHIRVVLALLEDQFGAFLHGDLDGTLTGPFHLLDTVVLAVENLLRLHDLSVVVPHEEVLDRVVRVDRVMALQEAPCILFMRDDHAAWRLFTEGDLGAGEAVGRVIRIVHRLSLKAALLRICGRIEHESGQVGIRLCQFEGPRLACIIATATPALE